MRRFPSEVLSENEAVAQEGAYLFEMGLGSASYFDIKGTEMGKIKGWAIFQLSQFRTERVKVLCWLRGAVQRDNQAVLAPGAQASCVVRGSGRSAPPHPCAVIHPGLGSVFRQEGTKTAAGEKESKNGDTTKEPSHSHPCQATGKHFPSSLIWSFWNEYALSIFPPFLRYKQKNT